MSLLDGIMGRLAELAGTILPGRKYLNFGLGFSVRDNPANNSTDIDQAVSTTANLTTLAAIPAASFLVGTPVLVQSKREEFNYTPESIDPEDGRVVSASGGGAWVRSGRPSPDWGYQTSWGVDAVDGDDDGPGTPSSPLKSLTELGRRRQTIDNSINYPLATVSILRDNASEDVRLDLAQTIQIDGTAGRTALASGVITSVTTGVAKVSPWKIQASGISSWTAYVSPAKCFAVITSGPQNGCVFALELDLGSGTVQISPPGMTGTFGDPTIVAPHVGDAFTIYKLPILSHTFSWRRGELLATSLQLSAMTATHEVEISDEALLFADTCIVKELDFGNQAGNVLCNVLVISGEVRAYPSATINLFNSTLYQSGIEIQGAPAEKSEVGGLDIIGGRIRIYDGGNLINNLGWLAWFGSTGCLSIARAGVCDSTAQSSGDEGQLWGTANPSGGGNVRIAIEQGGTLYYKTGKEPAILGSGSPDFSVGSTTANYTDLPYTSGPDNIHIIPRTFRT